MMKAEVGRMDRLALGWKKRDGGRIGMRDLGKAGRA